MRRALVVAVGLATLASATLAWAVDGVIEINQPTALAGGVTSVDAPGFPVTLDSPGSYRLTSNLTVPDVETTAIDVMADFVTLDLNGFTIFGPGGSGAGDGVFSSGEHTQVENGNVSGLGDDGLDLGDGAVVAGVTATANGGDGIAAGLDSLLTGNMAKDNAGFGLRVGDGTALKGNSVSGNNGSGPGTENSQIAGAGVVEIATNLCDGGTSCLRCGDGFASLSETCDDGNTVPNDGCDESCQLEVGFQCGDGLIRAGEECDDGNMFTGDGCSPLCVVETGWECAGEPSVCTGECGDGIVTESEECDDQGVVAGDGCSDTCMLELGYFCSGQPSTCFDGVRVFTTDSRSTGDLGGVTGADATCNSAASAAGLGGSWAAWIADDVDSPATRFGQSALAYRLLDGTAIASDWSDLTDGSLIAPINLTENQAPVQIPGLVWSNVGTDGAVPASPVDCLDWGDGTLDELGSTGRAIDAGTGWTAIGLSNCGSFNHLYCFEQFTCGDGSVHGGEQCDDGGLVPGDGCDASCVAEHGWECSGEPSSCAEVCGNGSISSGEQCDDGAVAGGDGCDATCNLEPGFDCVGEPSICIPIVCGDDFIGAGEECDDGNTTPGDGCSDTCTVEPGFFCTGAVSTCFDGVRVFAASTGTDGNLGGLSGADAICDAAAAGAGLSGSWLAWLADGVDSPSTRFSQSPLPYRLLDGTAIASNWADLTDGALAAPIDLSESLGGVGTIAWSNVRSTGAISGFPNDCLGWTSASPDEFGNGGRTTDSGSSWTEVGLSDCSNVNFLYCFEDFSCGDGAVQGGEQCDDGGTSPGDGCDAQCLVEPPWQCTGEPSVCTFNAKRVFVTSATYTGDFGGVAAADANCATLASNAGLSGTFLAWVADSTLSSAPSVRFTQATGPYALVDDTVVADDWADLTDGASSLAAAISRTEQNDVVADRVWTNVTSTGDRDGGPSCTDWTSVSGATGLYGCLTTDTWTECGSNLCGTTARLYCFEQ